MRMKISPQGMLRAFTAVQSRCHALFHRLYIWNGTNASHVAQASTLAHAYQLQRALSDNADALFHLYAASSPLRTETVTIVTDNGLSFEDLLRPQGQLRQQRTSLFARSAAALADAQKATSGATESCSEVSGVDDMSSSSSSSTKMRPSSKRGRLALSNKRAATMRVAVPALSLGLLKGKSAKTPSSKKIRPTFKLQLGGVRPQPTGGKVPPLKLNRAATLKPVRGDMDSESTSSETIKTPKMSKPEMIRFFDPICSKILDFVYLGSRCPAMSRDMLKANGITHILNCAGTIVDNYFPDDFEYTTLALVDGGSEDISCLFYHILDLFERVRLNEQRIYVHCHAGISRSSSFVIAYLMWSENWPFLKAHEFTKNIRGTVNPNGGFIGQLLQWWSRIHAPITSTRLYRIFSHSQDPDFLVPKFVPKANAAALDPRTVFVLHTGSHVFAWYGNKALPRYRAAAARIHRQLVNYESAVASLTEVEQGHEPNAFWAALGGRGMVAENAAYNNDYSPEALNAPKPRSLLDKRFFDDDQAGDHITETRTLLYLYPNNFLVDTTTAADYERVTDRAPLESNCLYILVTAKREKIYAWIGRTFNPPGGEPKEQFALDALRAFQKLHPHLFVDMQASDVQHMIVHDTANGGGGTAAIDEGFWNELDTARKRI